MKIKKIAALLLITALLLSGCGEAEDSRDFLSIWCLDSEPLRLPMEALIKEYNENLPEGLLPARLRSFPDEKALSEGFDTLRPDILICSHVRSKDLYERGLSRDMSSLLFDNPPEYPDYIKDRLKEAGSFYLPVGGDIQIIALRENVSEGLEDLSSVLKKAREYGEEKRLPFMTADSFSALFYQCLLAEGKEFHALSLRDMKNPAYADTWNLISDAAFAHGLIASDTPGTELIESKYLPCAVVKSSALAGRDLKDIKLLPAEGLGESENILSSVSGFALTVREGRSEKSAGAFIGWLSQDNRLSRLALSSGLVPLTESPGAEETELNKLLLSAARGRRLHLPEGGCDWLLNKETFERFFRENLLLLD